MQPEIIGKWYLAFSNFPMWKDKHIHGVSFNYTPMVKDNKPCLHDVVEYKNKHKEKSIIGIDEYEEKEPRIFKWRGSGLLRWFTSTWQVEWMNEMKTCAIISFNKTWFTPAGLDIITRDKFADNHLISEALHIVKASNRLTHTGDRMFRVG